MKMSEDTPDRSEQELMALNGEDERNDQSPVVSENTESDAGAQLTLEIDVEDVEYDGLKQPTQQRGGFRTSSGAAVIPSASSVTGSGNGGNESPATPIGAPGYVYHHTEKEEQVAYFVALNAIVQLIGDIVLEILALVPPRINHLSLTFLNAYISGMTLKAIHWDEFKFLRADSQVFCILEMLLIMGDVYYAAHDHFDPFFIYVRLFFIACSTFNLGFTIYIMTKYKFWEF